MISSYNITTQNVAVDGLLTFTTDRILTGCTVTRNGPTFQLNKPGYYYVTFNADGAATTAVGDIVVVTIGDFSEEMFFVDKLRWLHIEVV